MKSKIFLVLSFALFVGITGKFMFGGFGETWNKVSTDDHYAWILKTSQMLDCPDAKCRFIEDTRIHTKLDYVNLPYDRNLQRWREQHCLFDIYTPLYTVVMIGYKKLFNLSNWEQAYQAASVTGFIICTLGALAFLVSLFGYLPAAIGFLFMSLCKWGWLSFGVISPSFFISGVMFWVLTLFVRKPDLFLKFLGLIIFLMSVYHPIGKVYSVGLLLLTGFYFFENLTREWRIRIYFVLAGLCFAGVIALGFVEQPQFKLAAFPFVDRHEIWTHFAKNVESLLSVYAWFFYIPTEYVSAGFLSVGLILTLIYLVGKTNRRNLVGILLFFFTAISIFHMFRNYPGELSSRVIIPLFVYMCGAFGVIIAGFIHYGKKKKMAVGVLVSLFALALYTRYLSPNEVFSIPDSRQFLTAKDNLYDPKQVQKLFDKDGNCGTVMYLDQTPMWVYSLYGSLKCGALVPYLWSLPNAEFTQMTKNTKDLSHFVSFNPIYNTFGVPIVHDRRKFLINFDNLDAKKFLLTLKAHEEPAALEIVHAQGSSTALDRKIIEIKPHSETTLAIVVKAGEQLFFNAPAGPVMIVKASFSENLNWPWKERVTFSALDTDESGKPVSRRDMNLLQWQTAIENFLKMDLGIVDDSKASILMTASFRNE